MASTYTPTYGPMLRTPDDVIAALRARKDELGLSNQVLDELVGLTSGHIDKVIGPTRSRGMSLDVFLAIAGTMGMALQLVPDQDRTERLAPRWSRRDKQYVRAYKLITVKRARGLARKALARKGGLSRWLGRSAEERQAHIAMMNLRRAARRLASKNESACG